LTSLYGRRLGLDQNGHLVGPLSFRVPTEGIASSAGTTDYVALTSLTAYGVSVVGSTSSGSAAYTLASPIPGVVKYIVNPTTATITVASTAGGAYFALSSAGGTVSGTTITTTRGGIGLQLLGMTTAAWAVIGTNDVISSASTRVTISA